MHRIGVVGLSYRHAGIDDVARLSIPKEALEGRLPALREALGVSELLYLGTCNRVELLFATQGGEFAGDLRQPALEQLTGQPAPQGQASRLLRAWAGESALEHVLLLACGLDSAQAGEREIAAQLRAAWEAARAAGTSGPMLDRLMGEALGMANRVQRLHAGKGASSLADLAAARVLDHLAGDPGTVALVGVSPMTRRCGLALHRAGVPLLIVNRTLAPAAELAESLGARAVALEQFREQPGAIAALVLAAGGGALLDAPSLQELAGGAARALRERSARGHAAAPLAVDFGVPPNIDPEEADRAGIIRVGMSDLVQEVQQRRVTELLRLAPVRAAIDDRLTRLRDEMAARAIGPHLAQLRGAFERIAGDELDRALAEELRELAPDQRDAVRQLTSRLAHRLAHLPIAGMRAAATHASPEVIDAFFREARLHRTARRPAPGAARPASPADGLDGRAREETGTPGNSLP
jgi:glutamyl-tRNA reductase